MGNVHYRETQQKLRQTVAKGKKKRRWKPCKVWSWKKKGKLNEIQISVLPGFASQGWAFHEIKHLQEIRNTTWKQTTSKHSTKLQRFKNLLTRSSHSLKNSRERRNREIKCWYIPPLPQGSSQTVSNRYLVIRRAAEQIQSPMEPWKFVSTSGKRKSTRPWKIQGNVLDENSSAVDS